MTDRDPTTGKFLPGNRANPGGRPKSDLSLTVLIDEVVSPNDWRFIIATLKKRARRGDVRAIEMLMDRRFGKPVQQTEANVNLSGGLVLEMFNSNLKKVYGGNNSGSNDIPQ